ncbi:MAG: MetQ/NlpA family ABC transporter substrate-binding protein [Bifidobacteriaceae bacterium]|jgi:D-methionine transport system substrate-binding protein|nr:MetQ/NlpA family ABC transporter substrate-binding protein [Bifidobacteriaceae bacterium]
MKKTAPVALITAFAAALTLSSCGSKDDDNKDLTTITVGASPVPHGEILQYVRDNLAEAAGINLKIVEYQDYILPNKALSQGDLDANYFQHVPYLEAQEAEYDYDFYAFEGIHIEPLGIYSSKHDSLDQVADGSVIGVSNDPANQARGLWLLEDAGIIKLNDTGDRDPTIDDLAADSPYNVELIELESKLLAVNLPDLDYSVINGNYALDAGLSPAKDALLAETAVDNPYVNILVTTSAKQNDADLKKLNDLLHSPEVKKFIQERWTDNSVVPAF